MIAVVAVIGLALLLLNADKLAGKAIEQPPVCGDGVVDETIEQCDDSNQVSGDGCSSACQTEQQVQCIDNDGGLDSSVKGLVTYANQQFEDTCEGTGYVQEWYCLNNLPDDQSLTCRFRNNLPSWSLPDRTASSMY